MLRYVWLFSEIVLARSLRIAGKRLAAYLFRPRELRANVISELIEIRGIHLTEVNCRKSLAMYTHLCHVEASAKLLILTARMMYTY